MNMKTKRWLDRAIPGVLTVLFVSSSIATLAACVFIRVYGPTASSEPAPGSICLLVWLLLTGSAR
jgi:hypothetical protein